MRPGAPLVLTAANELTRVALGLRGYESRHVATSVGRIHVLEARGSGPLPTLALLHGISSASVHFVRLLPRLRGHVRRLVMPDLPGHGFSDAPSSLRPEALRDALVEVMDAVLDEPCVLFGNSLGGAAAIEYALARPSRVRGLVLCSPSGAAMDEAELARFVHGFDFARHAEALDFVDRLFSRPNRMRHAVAWGVRRSFRDPSVRSLLAAIGPEHLLRPEQLAALRMPVLLVWGRDERILPRSQLEFFRRYLPAHARIEEPEGHGHAPYLLDAPDAVARRILAFAEDVTAGRAKGAGAGR
jgi:pimeloyl-ACP methyl ester carboxylesterase